MVTENQVSRDATAPGSGAFFRSKARSAPKLRVAANLPSPLLRMIAIFSAMLAISTDGWAQNDRRYPDVDSPGLTIDAVLGWDGFADRSTPLTLSFLIRNDSPRTIEGILTIEDFGRGRRVSLGEVVVAAGTSRRVTTIQSLSEWSECFAALSHRGDLLWRRELDLNAGKSFSPNVNYALYVDGTGRKLELPGAPADSTTLDYHQLQVPGTAGRPVQTLTAKPWQLPHHPGPLSVLQAIMIPPGSDPRDLNQVQWQSIAAWMCQGGVVFVPRSDQETIERLVQSSPLTGDLASERAPFIVRRFGLGAILSYDGALSPPGDSALLQAMSRELAERPKDQFHSAVDSAQFYRRRERQADYNRSLVIGLFAGYALLLGGGGLFLFRLNQRQVAAYTIAIVTLASLLAATLGGYLRFSKGDLDWVTVTQAGSGGLIQFAGIQVQSAGGQSSRVAVQGDHANLQPGGIVRYDYYGPQRQVGYSPFTWQPNLETTAEDVYQIQISLSPWGRRRCHATAFRSEPRQVELDLRFEPTNATPPAIDALPTGNLQLKLTNALPFDLKNCWLIIGATVICPPNSSLLTQLQARGYRYGMNRGTMTVDNQIDVYHQQRLQNFASGATFEAQFPANFTLSQPQEMGQIWPGGTAFPLKIPKMGSAKAWLVGHLATSPILSIDEQRSDFVAHEGAHLYIQEIETAAFSMP